MKKWSLFISFCSVIFCFSSPIQDHQIDPIALSQLTVYLGIPKDADTLVETQKRWLRTTGQERWEMAELPLEQKLFVLNWGKEHGLFDPWKPLYKKYDQALILGATTGRMQMRLDYLKQLWEDGVRFDQIVWLTGDRPLDLHIDQLTDRCQNESEAAHLIWEETHLPLEMRKILVNFIAVPMMDNGKRPNTEDTLIAWLENAEPCTALFVSDQPFCGYQFAIIKGTLPEAFEFDLVGQGVDPMSHPAAAAITLDSLARWIYQEKLIQQSKEK